MVDAAREGVFQRGVESADHRSGHRGSGAQAAANIGGLKKGEMAEQAEALLTGAGWLPLLLRV
jgi:hypothetical protein